MKRLLTTIFTIIMLSNMSVTSYAILPEYGEEYQNQPSKEYLQTFKDVTNDFWAFDYIEEMVEREVLSGYPNGNFYPNNTVSRAEFAKIMCLAAGLTVNKVDNSSYEDVKVSAWYAPYVECGRYYLSGYVSNGKKYYKPEDKALREDIAVALVKLKGYDTSVYDESILKVMFNDWQSISEGARKYVAVAVENGLISGYEDNTFRGQASITRAQAATLLWRAYQYGNGNKVFEKEEIEEMPTVETEKKEESQNTTNVEIKEETEKEKVELSLDIPKTKYTLESGESLDFVVSVKYNVGGEYEPIITGNTEIIESTSVTDNNMVLRNSYTTKKLEPGKYKLTFSITDDKKTHEGTIDITVNEPEPEYTYEMDTLLKDIEGILIMEATNDSVVCLTGTINYLSGEYIEIEYGNIIEIKNNKIQTLLDPKHTGYLGDKELSKEELATRYNEAKVYALGYNEYDKCPYAILYQMEYYLYNLYTKEAQPLDLGEYISVGLGAEKHVTFCINELEEIIFGGEFYVTTEGFSDFEDSGAVTINGKVFSTKSLRYINNRTGKIEEVDYYIPNGSRIFAANNNCHYAVDSKYENIYMVDTTGEYEFLLSVDDIDNVDKRKIDLTKLDKSHSIPNSVVDNNGIIYFYDKEYGCVRCIRKK